MGASHEIDEVAGREERRTVPPLHGAFLPSVAAALLRARRSPAQQSLTVGPLPAGAQPARRSRPAPPAAEPLPQRSDMSCRRRRAGATGAEDRKSVVEGKSGSVSVDSGGRRRIKKK